MSGLLFPRLELRDVRDLLEHARGHDPLRPEAMRARAEPLARWAPSGGRRATESELDELRTEIVALAVEARGGGRGIVAARGEFDLHCTAAMAERGWLAGGEGLRDDVWSWIAIALVPDICAWRFPEFPEDRFAGGRRNTMQRLWLRARAFDGGDGSPDRWKLVRELPEDAMVQVMERPSIGADARVAASIGNGWLAARGSVQPSQTEDLMRLAARDIRITNEVLSLGSLGDAELRILIEEQFQRAVGQLRVTQPAA